MVLRYMLPLCSVTKFLGLQASPSWTANETLTFVFNGRVHGSLKSPLPATALSSFVRENNDPLDHFLCCLPDHAILRTAALSFSSNNFVNHRQVSLQNYLLNKNLF